MFILGIMCFGDAVATPNRTNTWFHNTMLDPNMEQTPESLVQHTVNPASILETASTLHATLTKISPFLLLQLATSHGSTKTSH